MEWLLRKIFPWKEIGWKEIGEEFTRYTILKLPSWLGGFKIFLHQLKAETWRGECHNHPWDFVTIILSGGYDELHKGKIVRRKPGFMGYRPANWSHDVRTYGTSWSIIFVGPKKQNWCFHECDHVQGNLSSYPKRSKILSDDPTQNVRGVESKTLRGHDLIHSTYSNLS